MIPKVSDGEKTGSSASSAWRAGPVGFLINFGLTVIFTCLGVGLLYGVAGLAQLGLIDAGLLTVSLSMACPLVTMVQFVAPAPLVINAIRKNGSGLPVQTFMSQAGCNILGISYGIQITNSAVLVTNMFGLGMQTLFLSADHFLRTQNSRWIQFSLKLMAVFHGSLIFFATITPINILGHCITGLNIFLYASPLAMVSGILRTRNASALPVAMTYISVANNALWTLYALMIQDSVVLLPSVLGYMLSAFQVLVLLWCAGSLPFDLTFLLLLCRDGRREGKRELEELDDIVAKANGTL